MGKKRVLDWLDDRTDKTGRGPLDMTREGTPWWIGRYARTLCPLIMCMCVWCPCIEMIRMNVLKDTGSVACWKQPLTRPVWLVVLFTFHTCSYLTGAFEVFVGYIVGVPILILQHPTFLVPVHTMKAQRGCGAITLLILNLLKPTGYVMHHQFNMQQLYALPTLYLCVLYLSGNFYSRRLIWELLFRKVYGGGERDAQGSGGETWGKETTGETQTQMGG